MGLGAPCTFLPSARTSEEMVRGSSKVEAAARGFEESSREGKERSCTCQPNLMILKLHSTSASRLSSLKRASVNILSREAKC
jgi:hypothetical protein